MLLTAASANVGQARADSTGGGNGTVNFLIKAMTRPGHTSIIPLKTTRFRFSVTLFLLLFCQALSLPGTARAAGTWSDLGLYGGQILSVAVDHHNQDVIYAGSWDGDGLFCSADGGDSWHTLPADDTTWFKNQEVFDIAVDSRNSAIVWVANGWYLDVSYDYGDSFRTFYFAAEESRLCYCVAIDPHDETGQTVYVGTGGPNGTETWGAVYKTTDGGHTWQAIKTALYSILDIKIHPHNPGELWAVSSPWSEAAGAPGALLNSTNGGRTWRSCYRAAPGSGGACTLGPLDEILLDASDAGGHIACGSEGVLVAKHAARDTVFWQWSMIQERCSSLCPDAEDPHVIYAGLDRSVARSTDGGITWSSMPPVTDRYLRMTHARGSTPALYAGSCNSGVCRTDDGASSWTMINSGITANTIYDSIVLPDNDSLVLCAAHGGLYKSSEAGTWLRLHSEAAYAVCAHPASADLLYAGFDQAVGKSTDAGATWSFCPIPGVSITSVAPCPDSTETVFAAAEHYSGAGGSVLRLHCSGEFADAAVDELLAADVPVNAVAVHPARPATLAAGTGGFYAPGVPGALHISSDGGASWQKSLAHVVVNSIAFSPADPDVVYAACGESGTGYAGLFASTDGGSTWNAAVRGLPYYYSAVDLHVDTDDPSILYAAMFQALTFDGIDLGGVYVSLDNGAYWTQMGLSHYFLYSVGSSRLPEKQERFRNTLQSASEPLPAADAVFAGTASGLLGSQLSGSGTITGSITVAGTGGRIDKAVIRADCGAACISSDGLYMMVVPAGTHELAVHAEGYVQDATNSITVRAGASASHDITMQPVSEQPFCLAEQLFAQSSEGSSLRLLRRVRDELLCATPQGRRLCTLYYRLGRGLQAVLKRSPHLRARLKQIAVPALQVFATALAGATPHIDAGLLSDVSGLLLDIAQQSPHDVRSAITEVRRILRRSPPLFIMQPQADRPPGLSIPRPRQARR